MADSLATPAAATPTATLDGRPAVMRIGVVLRDIARGGFTGIIVGIFVAGVGGRLVMRLATILHEDAVGLTTENGELIGRISFNGTMALITFGGLGMGLLAGVDLGHRQPVDPGPGHDPGARDGPRGNRPRDAAAHPAVQPGLLHPRPRSAHRRDARRPRGARRTVDGARRRRPRCPPAAPVASGPHLDRGLPHRHAAGRRADPAGGRVDPADPGRLRRGHPARLGAGGRGRLHPCLVAASLPGAGPRRRLRSGWSPRRRC